MSNTAKDIIVPSETGVLRVIFLYVGQGEATLLVIPDGENNKFMLIDSNLDEDNGGIDLVKLLTDLLDDSLNIFVNTHPHIDHIKGVKGIYDSVGIDEIWHSGHIPGGDHKEAYKEFEKVLKKVSDDNIYILKGSRDENKLDDNDYELGDIDFNILSPAEYVIDEIEDEKPEERYKRIHEQCGVIKFMYGEEQKQVLITGDSDLAAWKDHITDYHKDRLPSFVLSASHHGSRTFFKVDKDDEEIYTDHIEAISPTYLVISAPKQEESKHDHPHDDALEIYQEYFEEDNILHLGANRECVIVDIYQDGQIDIHLDTKLVETYGFGNDDDNKSGMVKSSAAIVTTIDKKPMG